MLPRHLKPLSREWRFQNLVIPLCVGGPSPAARCGRPLNEVAYLLFRAVQDKQQTSLLITALTNLVHELQAKPGNCITEAELLDTFKKVALQVLPPKEIEAIFVNPDAAKKVTRRPSRKQSKRRTQSKSLPSINDNVNSIPEA